MAGVLGTVNRCCFKCSTVTRECRIRPLLLQTYLSTPINRPAGLDLVMGLRRGNAEGNASSAECSPFRQIGTTGRVARSPTVGDSKAPSYPLMPARLIGDDDGRRRLPPESAVVVCDRARQRSGGVSDPPPKRGKCLPPDPGGSLTPPLRTCLFTWYAAVHASRCASAMPRALTPPVFLPTRARRTRQR